MRPVDKIKRMVVRSAALTAVGFVALFAQAALAQGSGFEQAERLYRQTNYHGALEILKHQPQTAPVLFLSGRCLYYEGDYKQAVRSLERATAADPRNASYQNWLGKAWGRRAETANIFQAPGFANRAREAFERAVAIDSAYMEALEDLFQYYLEAPGFLGGGLDKAEGLLPRIKQTDAAEYHAAKAQIAEKTKDYSSAEAQLRRAVSIAPRKLVDLARFLARRGRVKEADAVFADAARVVPDSKERLFAQAEVYVETKRNPEEARRLLSRYLSMPLTPDDPPRQEAEKLLKKIGG